jgi:PAS domain S-box-containing protein
MSEKSTASRSLPEGLCSALLEQSADAIVFANLEGTIQLWNAAAERLFGFPPEQAVGQNLDIMIPEKLRAPHWAGFKAAMTHGRTKHSGRPMVTKALHASGETVYVEMSFAVITDLKGASLGSIAIARTSKKPEPPKA